MGNHPLYEHMRPLPNPKHPTTMQEVCAHLLPKLPYTFKWPHYSFIQHPSKKCAHSFIHSFIHSHTKVCPSSNHPCPRSISYGFTNFFISPSWPNDVVLGTLLPFRYFACQYCTHSHATSSFVFVPPINYTWHVAHHSIFTFICIYLFTYLVP